MTLLLQLCHSDSHCDKNLSQRITAVCMNADQKIKPTKPAKPGTKQGKMLKKFLQRDQSVWNLPIHKIFQWNFLNEVLVNTVITMMTPIPWWWNVDFVWMNRASMQSQSSGPAVFWNVSTLMKGMTQWQWKLVSPGCFSSTPLISESRGGFCTTMCTNWITVVFGQGTKLSVTSKYFSSAYKTDSLSFCLLNITVIEHIEVLC